MSRRMTKQSGQQDWVAGSRTYLFAWGIPTAVLLAGVVLPEQVRVFIWTAALVWMGTACILNALRCGRIHCYLTGPFFLLMAVAVLLHGFGFLWLGPNGWLWLGLTLVVVGGALLWYLPERLWGKYAR
jgi:hypothetical protein